MIGEASRWRRILAAGALLTVAACGRDAPETTRERTVVHRPALTTSTTVTTTTTTTAPSTTTTVATPTPPAPSTTASPPPTRPHPARVVHEQAWAPFAVVGPVTLHHPSDRVEAIGFHQSGHDGAQQQIASASASRWFTMASRDRDTGPQGAADIVIEPDREIRAPVTGTVLRAGTYTLYCDHVDQFAVIEPDARPGWEVKVIHIEGLALTKGQRVEAGVTRVAARARVLPFPSQVEEDTGLPSWPHVHVEVVDPSIDDRPGHGCP